GAKTPCSCTCRSGSRHLPGGSYWRGARAIPAPRRSPPFATRSSAWTSRGSSSCRRRSRKPTERVHGTLMKPQYPGVDSVVGNTPLVRLQRIDAGIHAANGNVVLAKLEGNNPAGSVKDRAALSMIARAEARGTIRPGDTLIEATSGNTGIALAMVAAVRGYRMVLVMPDNQTVRSEEHTSELQSRENLVCRLLLEKKK